MPKILFIGYKQYYFDELETSDLDINIFTELQKSQIGIGYLTELWRHKNDYIELQRRPGGTRRSRDSAQSLLTRDWRYCRTKSTGSASQHAASRTSKSSLANVPNIARYHAAVCKIPAASIRSTTRSARAVRRASWSCTTSVRINSMAVLLLKMCPS